MDFIDGDISRVLNNFNIIDDSSRNKGHLVYIQWKSLLLKLWDDLDPVTKLHRNSSHLRGRMISKRYDLYDTLEMALLHMVRNPEIYLDLTPTQGELF